MKGSVRIVRLRRVEEKFFAPIKGPATDVLLDMESFPIQGQFEVQV